MDLSWEGNRKSLIGVVSGIVFLIMLRATGGGLIIGAIAGVVVYGGLYWLLDRILPKVK